MKIENAVIIRSETRLEQLEKKFNTKAQAKFYIKRKKEIFETVLEKKTAKNQTNTKRIKVSKNENFKIYEKEHEKILSVIEKVKKKVAKDFRIKEVLQKDLPYHIFSPKDLVLVIGQDGLVANSAKYVGYLPIIAINPLPEIFDGVLLPFREDNFEIAINKVITDNYKHEEITMAEVNLDDGQHLLAFNDFFVGISSHGSARYRIELQGFSENQSSSGLIISTGAGSTGWLSSIFNMTKNISRYLTSQDLNADSRFSKEANKLMFVVREPFISKHSSANLTIGEITPKNELIVESLMPQNGLIFSDGIQSDFLQFNSGSTAIFKIAVQKANLVKL